MPHTEAELRCTGSLFLKPQSSSVRRTCPTPSLPSGFTVTIESSISAMDIISFPSFSSEPSHNIIITRQMDANHDRDRGPTRGTPCNGPGILLSYHDNRPHKLCCWMVGQVLGLGYCPLMVVHSRWHRRGSISSASAAASHTHWQLPPSHGLEQFHIKWWKGVQYSL